MSEGCRDASRRMKGPLLTSVAPRFSAEVVAGLQAIGCHELAAEFPTLQIGPWKHDPGTGATSVRLVGTEPDPLEFIVATGYGRSLPLRLHGTVLVELDNFGRIYGLETFDRDDFLQELRDNAP